MRLEDVDFNALTLRRHRALANPLEAGDYLSPSGLSLDLSAITPAPNDPLSLHEQDIALQSPNPYRPPNSRLRDLLSRIPFPSSLRFELHEPRRADEDRWAQVWTAKVKRGEEDVGSVVLKLVAEALFPLETSTGFWKPAEEAVASEMASYKAFRALQGRDVLHLYGAFPFVMPWGETVVGFVLEDLCQSSIALYRYCEAHKQELKSIDDVDPLFTAAFGLLERLHHLGRTNFKPDSSDIRILDSSSPPTIHLVWLDFAQTIPVDEQKVRHEKRAAQVALYGCDLGPWHRQETLRLENVFDCHFPGINAAWGLRELKERKDGVYVRMLRGQQQ